MRTAHLEPEPDVMARTTCSDGALHKGPDVQDHDAAHVPLKARLAS